MHRHAESFSEQRLQHCGNLVLGSTIRQLGDDVITLGIEPVGRVDLIQLHLISIPDETLEGKIAVVNLLRVDGPTAGAACDCARTCGAPMAVNRIAPITPAGRSAPIAIYEEHTTNLLVLPSMLG